MKFSEKYTSLVTALLEARRQYGAVLKQKSNPHFGGKYADLAAVMDAVDDALSAVGIYPMQAVVRVEGEPLQLETRLMHTSGEYVVSHYPLSIKDSNPQAVGSAVTYARRYSLMALLGIAPEDDDAEAAVGRAPAKPEPKRQDAPKQAKPAAKQADPPPAAGKVPLLQERTRRLAAAIPGGWDALDAYAIAGNKGADFLATMEGLPGDEARAGVIAALEARVAKVGDWPDAYDALAKKHPRAAASAVQRLGLPADAVPTAAAAVVGVVLALMGLDK